MASEIRVDTLKTTSGLGTVTFGNNGAVLSGIVTATSLSATSSLQSNTLSVSSTGQVYSLGIGVVPSGNDGELVVKNDIIAFYSDIRLKKDIKNIENALDKVCSLNGVTYTSNDIALSYGYPIENQVGLIAHEVERVLPEVVKNAPFDVDFDDNGNIISRSGENYKTIKYEKIVPLLVEAIKELKQEIDQLKNSQ